MNGIIDAALTVAIVNLINTAVNIFWTIKLKSIQGNGELLRSLTDQNKAKDEIIKDKDVVIAQLMDKKNQYKNQYLQILGDYRDISGQLSAYKKHNGHPVDHKVLA